MNRPLALSLVAGGVASCLLLTSPRMTGAADAAGRTAPEFPSLAASSWAGTPTSMASLRGRVVLLNVWTFGCVNCQRTLPWVRSVAQRYRDRGLAVLGVHSPEFDRERDPRAVEEARARHKLDYPSYIDNGHLYWDALDNHYWPTVYLVDRGGKIHDLQIGEVHEGDGAAARLEREIETLLAEVPPPPRVP